MTSEGTPKLESLPLTEATKRKLVELIEQLATGGKRHWEIPESVDYVTFELPGGIDIDLTVRTPEEVAEMASYDWPTHEVGYTQVDEATQDTKGKIFSLVGPILYITPFISTVKERQESLYYAQSERLGELSLEEKEKCRRMRTARKAADELATYEAREADIVELNTILEGLKGKKPASEEELENS